jgi:hypothetical protein
MTVKSSGMKSVAFSLLLTILFAFSGNVKSQDAIKVLDRVYGLDQILYNGKKYTYSPPPGTKGHQYLLSPDYDSGSVTLRGKCYRDISLNYDIFNQQLLLRYEDETGPLNIIEVSKSWITGFRMGTMHFEFLSIGEESLFYQVLGEGRAQILYHWRKNLDVDGTIGSCGFTFTRTVRDSYVFMNGQLQPFSTKRSLIKLFDPAHKQEIKNYLRKNKINVKKSSDQVMAEMITFIGNLR